MTENPVVDLLSGPLGPDWTIEDLAEQLLASVAAKPESEFVVETAQITDRQSHRLIRPLLACLANMSAAESGTSGDIFGADLSFKRTGLGGTVWIFGQFKNIQGTARLMLRASTTPQMSGTANCELGHATTQIKSAEVPLEHSSNRSS